MGVGNRVRAQREHLKMTQDELAKILGYKSRSSINKIELGLTDIAQSKISAFAMALQTTPAYLMGFSEQQNNHVSVLINQLSQSAWDISVLDDGLYTIKKDGIAIEVTERDLEEITVSAQNFIDKKMTALFKRKLAVYQMKQLFIPYYGQIVSAGYGQFIFDDLPSEMIKIEDTPNNRQADFAIGVRGNSMETTYYDGDTLLVKKQSQVTIGEIGIFMINGESFVKELGINCLISHNPAYSPIQMNEAMRIDCIGKVIGKIQL